MKRLTRSIWKVLHRFAREYDVWGIRVFSVLSNAHESALHAAKLREAVSLIERHDPNRLKRIRCCISHIVVLGSGSSYGSYNESLRMCRINSDRLENPLVSPVEVAMTLVHESTHAFIASRGVSYREDLRARIERVCTRAELAFARRLPEYPAELAGRSASMLSLPNGYWSDYRIAQGAASDLRAVGIPRLVVHLLARLRLRQIQHRPGKPPHGRTSRQS